MPNTIHRYTVSWNGGDFADAYYTISYTADHGDWSSPIPFDIGTTDASTFADGFKTVLAAGFGVPTTEFSVTMGTETGSYFQFDVEYIGAFSGLDVGLVDFYETYPDSSVIPFTTHFTVTNQGNDAIAEVFTVSVGSATTGNFTIQGPAPYFSSTSINVFNDGYMIYLNPVQIQESMNFNYGSGLFTVTQPGSTDQVIITANSGGIMSDWYIAYNGTDGTPWLVVNTQGEDADHEQQSLYFTPDLSTYVGGAHFVFMNVNKSWNSNAADLESTCDSILSSGTVNVSGSGTEADPWIFDWAATGTVSDSILLPINEGNLYWYTLGFGGTVIQHGVPGSETASLFWSMAS